MLSQLSSNGHVLVLDGGLATELESLRADLNNALWSAAVLRDDPALIARVHASYVAAGADIVTTASYQATFEGFALQASVTSARGSCCDKA